MSHRFTLPIRPSPAHRNPQANSPHNQTPLESPTAPRSLRRSRVFSHALSTFRERESSLSAENAKPVDPPIIGSSGEVEAFQRAAGFDLADFTTWPAAGPAFIQNGAILSLHRQELPIVVETVEEGRGEHAPWGCASRVASASSSVFPHPDQLPQSIGDRRIFSRSDAPSPPSLRLDRVRSTSSSYPSEGKATTCKQSPVSPASPACANKLSLSDLSQFGDEINRMSLLRSSSSSETHPASEDFSTHEAVVEAAAAIKEWKGEPRSRITSYNAFELSDSSDFMPSDSTSQHTLSRTPSPASTEAKLTRQGRRRAETTLDRIRAIKSQFDGSGDARYVDSPDSAAQPGPALHANTQSRPSKRKASQFSLRSITSTLAKRPRLGLGKLTTAIYQGSSRRVSQARLKWRQQNEIDRRQFEAWRAARRKERPADPLKGKSEKGWSVFSFERSRFGNESWWQDGVARYQAPPWMVFHR